MDYEQLGTTAVINAVSKTNRLKAFVNSGDKEPSFDGNIYIYDNNIYSKDNIKRVPIQVKGKGVRSKPKDKIKYPVSVVDLDNYMRNGGAMFFVVYIDKDSGDTKQIYYSALLPFRISGLLKQKKSNDKSISINFDRFPKNAKDITDLFLNFHSESQRQISFVGVELPTIEDLCKKGLLESLSFSYVSTQSTPNFTSYPKIFDGKELYLYANVKDGVAPIPIEYYPKVTQLHMTCKDEIPISVNGTVYYNGFKKTITADTITFKIGSSVTIKFPNVDNLVADKDDLKVNLTIKLNGTLTQRIKALNFLIAMLDAKYFELGGAKFPANFPDAELKRLNVKNYPDILQTYNQIVGVLEKLHIKKDLPIDDFTKEDFWKLNTLVGAIENDKTVYNIKGDLPAIVNLNFGGLHLVLLCQKQDDGGYKL